jgi:hypothetical protein
MWQKTSIRAMLEPYARAYYLGEDRVSPRYQELLPPFPELKYSDMKTTLYEGAHEGVDEVFVKDMAYYMYKTPKYTPESLIPSGYKHTFLIRRPELAIPSMYRMFLSKKVTGWTFFDPNEAGYKELWQLYCTIKEKIDPNPLVIIDEELVAKPEEVMKYYCEKTGLKFEEKMLTWDPSDGLEERFDQSGFGAWKPFFEGALKAKGFQKEMPRSNKDLVGDLPAEVLKCVEDNKPYYDKLAEFAVRF